MLLEASRAKPLKFENSKNHNEINKISYNNSYDILIVFEWFLELRLQKSKLILFLSDTEVTQCDAMWCDAGQDHFWPTIPFGLFREREHPVMFRNMADLKEQFNEKRK